MPRVKHPTIVAIIGACALAYVATMSKANRVFDEYGAVPARFSQLWTEVTTGHLSGNAAGVLVTLVTPMFLHAGPEHLLLNMVFLWVFGCLIADVLGKWWALGLFFLLGACGNIAQICLNHESAIPIVGASGAVCGFEGLYLALALQWELDWPDVWPLSRPVPPLQLAAFAILGAVLDGYALLNREQGIAHGAHLGGFFAGIVVAALLTQWYPTKTAYDAARRKRRG